jgi:hypothetical protein
MFGHPPIAAIPPLETSAAVSLDALMEAGETDLKLSSLSWRVSNDVR